MRLYLLRHAIAVPHGTPGYADDAQRPLTDEGHAQARAVARGLKQLKLPVELILTSPYVRAMQTARHVAEVFGGRVPLKECAELQAEVAPRETSAALKGLSSTGHLLCVGHEPHLSAWVSELVAGPGGMQCLMKKSGAACIELPRVPPPAGSGTLRWLITPKQMALMAGTK